MPQAAGFIHDAAAKLEGAAASLRERSVDDIMRSLSDFASPATSDKVKESRQWRSQPLIDPSPTFFAI
jgi:hypothetical protein